ncbi:hypothetical protein Salmuc_04848 [Salipiger mucosus DSM 16094]|uniref:Uncharacterized protein n=1 Tax=Salipiger mucosus DSM 16094 TaxID=1123237 RepID=S9R113_9RHOB|nr:hypothetical protein Salmuc_04848 [Salipiger mucosus DSM 16094]
MLRLWEKALIGPSTRDHMIRCDESWRESIDSATRIPLFIPLSSA